MSTKNNTLVESFKCAFNGVKESLLLERNMFIHFLFVIITVICGFAFKISITEWLICIILFGLVISLELVNTAVEKTVDICISKIDERARIAKDTIAGAVLISAITSVIAGLIIFLPKFIEFIQLHLK